MNYLKGIIFLTTLLVLSRIIPHPPNFTPVIALSFYLPIIFGIWSLPLCILGFAITDYLIGFHSLLIWTWGSLLLVGLISKFSKKIINRLILVLLGSSVFFVFSNFVVLLIFLDFLVNIPIFYPPACLGTSRHKIEGKNQEKPQKNIR